MYTIKCRRVAEVQVGCSYADHKEQGTQFRHFKGSYHRVDKEENIIIMTTCYETTFGTKTLPCHG